jgi:hypothetical protein
MSSELVTTHCSTRETVQQQRPIADCVGRAELRLWRHAAVLSELYRMHCRTFPSNSETPVSNKKLKQLFDTNPAIIYFVLRSFGRPGLFAAAESNRDYFERRRTL